MPCHATDDYSAQNFIARLDVEPSKWRDLFLKAGNGIPTNMHHTADIHKIVAQRYRGGQLRIYKIPKLESLQALSKEPGWGITIVRGPKPHKKTKLKAEIIASEQEAEALLSSVGATEAGLTHLAMSNKLNDLFSFDGNNRARFIKLLSERKLLAYKIPVWQRTTVRKAEELIPAGGVGDRKVQPIMYKGVVTPSSAPQNVVSGDTKALPSQPKSLDEAAQRLKNAAPAVAAAKANNLPLPPSSYTLADKQAVIENGLQEKYLVRVIESKNAGDDGYIGKVREHGAAISWTAPFTMVEHGDTDAEALLNAFGTRHDPAKNYTFLIIDRDKLNEIGDMQAVIPTNKNLQKLLAENPHITEISPDVTKQVLSEEFAPKYYKFAKGMTADGVNQSEQDEMRRYAVKQGFTPDEAGLLIDRHQLANDVSAWEEFTGNGMTLDTNVKNATAYGPVEVIMLDKKPLTLGVLKQQKALTSLSAS